jgi:hypothetical protein
MKMKRLANVSSKTLMLSIMITGVMVSAHWLATRASAEPKSDKKKQPARMNTASANTDATFNNAAGVVVQGQHIFRFNSLGDETFWGDTLLLHQAIEGANFWGASQGLDDPAVALVPGVAGCGQQL